MFVDVCQDLTVGPTDFPLVKVGRVESFGAAPMARFVLSINTFVGKFSNAAKKLKLPPHGPSVSIEI